MENKGFIEKIEVPADVQVSLNDKEITFKGSKGELTKNIMEPGINVSVDSNLIELTSNKSSKREKKQIKTYVALIKNVFKGVTEGHYYKLKICASHFPMTVSMKGDSLEVKNYIGEKVPRVLKIKDNVTVKIEGKDFVTVESIDKAKAGQVAADIEILTRRNGFDRRIFQDGIYIINKDGKDLQ